MNSVSTEITADVFEHVDQEKERRRERIRMNRVNDWEESVPFKGKQPKYKDECMRRSDPAKAVVA